MGFKERMGFEEKKVLQLTSMDNDLRRHIWDLVYIFFSAGKPAEEDIYNNAVKIASRVLKLDLETIHRNCPVYNESAYNLHYNIKWFCAKLRDLIYEGDYRDVCVLLECLVQKCNSVSWPMDEMVRIFNTMWEKEQFGYRFDDAGEILPITDDIELEELNGTRLLSPESVTHFEKAKIAFSGKPTADYNLCVQEVVKGLEALFREITGNPSATLGDAIGYVRKKALLPNMNDRLLEGLNKLSGFANDYVRHAMKPTHNTISFEEAKLILVLGASIASYINAEVIKFKP